MLNDDVKESAANKRGNVFWLTLTVFIGIDAVLAYVVFSI
jgi:hypothetical protein